MECRVSEDWGSIRWVLEIMAERHRTVPPERALENGRGTKQENHFLAKTTKCRGGLGNMGAKTKKMKF